MASVIYRRLPASVSRDRERVSDEWYWVILEIRRRGVKFNVNEGHRTMARQAELVRELGLYPNGKNGPNTGAAAPSNTAPHIRTGRFDHALDLDGIDPFMSKLRALGIPCAKTVPGESWHCETTNAAALARVSKQFKAAATKRAKLQAEIRRVTALRKKSYKNKNWAWWKRYAAQVKALQKKLKAIK